MYHTEPPTDKTIREWYMKFQQSGGLFVSEVPEGLMNYPVRFEIK
jgi:hypothetical protein